MTAPSRSKNIFFNSTALVAATLVSRAFSVPVAALLVRHLEPVVLGEYLYLTGVVGLFAPLVTLGTPLYLAREVVQQPERAPVLLKAAYLLQLAAGSVAVLLCVVAGRENWLLALAAMGMVAQATASLFQNAIIGLGRGTVASGLQATGSLIHSVSLLAVLLVQPSLSAVIWQFVLSGLVQHLLGYLALRRYCPELRFAQNWPKLSDYRMVFIASLPNGLLVVFATLYFRVDTALIAAWGNLVEVARYGAAFKFIELGASVMSLVSWVFFAEFSAMYARGDAQIVRVARRGMRYMLVCCLPVALLTSFYARDILYGFYGDEYTVSAPILQVLAWTTVFLFARELLGSLLQAHNLVRVQVQIYALSLLVNVALNYWWIPWLGGIGAAAATLLCEVFNCLAFGWVCHRRFALQPFGSFLLPIALASTAMALGLWLLQTWPAPVGALGGLVLFAAAYWRWDGFVAEDRLLLAQAIAWIKHRWATSTSRGSRPRKV